MSAGEGGSRAEELAALRDAVESVQHEINNPLAALLAEAQLLSLEPTLSPDHRQAAERMVALVRRVITTLRKLDSVRGEPTL